MTWREELHPRDDLGRFTHKASLPAVSIKNTLANLRAASDDDLMDVFGRLGRKKQMSKRTLQAIIDELERREGGALDEPDDTPEQKKIDDLVRRGWSYADAYADVYNVSADRIAAEERNALVDRRKGETPEQARRRAYAEVVTLEVLQAEEATNGYLLSKQCRGVEPASLWSGPPARARKCASEELLRWWDANGGRRTYTAWKAQIGGSRADRRRAKVSAGSGNGRDFGV